MSQLFMQAVKNFQTGKLGKAETLCRRILATSPGHPEVLNLQGLISWQKGDLENAEKLIKKALDKTGEDADYLKNLGLILSESGKNEEAETLCRRAAKLNPGDPGIHNNLGISLENQNRLEEAEKAYRTAISLAPNHVNALLNLGSVLRQLGQREGAVDCYQRAISLVKNLAPAYANLGGVLAEMGYLEKAEQACRKAVSLAPKDLNSLGNLGTVLLMKGGFAGAKKTYATGLKLAPGSAEFLIGLSLAQSGMGNYDEAMDQLNRALEISPDSAKAHNALGQLHLIIGNLDQALAAFREAADLDPDYPPPVCSLAGAADEQISDQHLATLKAFLERPNLTLQQRKDIHFAVARSLEKKSDWDIAFTHFFEANTIKRDLLIKSEIQSEADVLVRSIGDIKTVFSADFFAKRAAYGIDSDLPVFILGMPRSGTTLVEQILAGHSGVFGAGELDDIDLTVAKLNAAFAEAEKYPFWAGKIDREKSRTIANDYVAVLREKSPDARRIIDKMPFNFFHLGLLALLFPKAKIINCRRNPNDLGLSCYFQNFEAPHRWATELEQIGVFYREYENLMRHWSSVLPIPIIDVDYETLVADSLSEGQRLIAFLGLEWEDQCLAIAETKRPVRTASNWQVRQPIYNTSVERWRPYEAQLEPFIKAFSAK